MSLVDLPFHRKSIHIINSKCITSCIEFCVYYERKDHSEKYLTGLMLITYLLTKLLLEHVYIGLINKAEPKHLLPSPRDCGLDSHELRYC